MITITACAIAPAESRHPGSPRNLLRRGPHEACFVGWDGVDQVWTVRVDAVLSDDAAAKANDTALESMIELMLRTQGVSSARLMLGGEDPAVLNVEVSLVATSWGQAVRRATALVQSCAGYAGLRNLSLRYGWLAA